VVAVPDRPRRRAPPRLSTEPWLSAIKFAQNLARFLEKKPASRPPWRFDDVVAGHRKRLREVALLELDGDRIASLREHWASEAVSSGS
jgi:hypothetical protein